MVMNSTQFVGSLCMLLLRLSLSFFLPSVLIHGPTSSSWFISTCDLFVNVSFFSSSCQFPCTMTICMTKQLENLKKKKHTAIFIEKKTFMWWMLIVSNLPWKHLWLGQKRVYIIKHLQIFDAHLMHYIQQGLLVK